MSDFIAYIDPGAGSLIVQVVIASVIAIPIFFRTQIARFVQLVRRPKQVEPAADERVVTD